eukprot:TRINITY_DN15435_c0_g1_i1.p1 TRINITY_DN15435_c0_g1~~TRINITY_DN15435_c0_g1_i1.p1  ORF type:complete len:847 (+),score=384.63 TRINITY_DN15435_c0_g1_i1:159-2699(+)
MAGMVRKQQAVAFGTRGEKEVEAVEEDVDDDESASSAEDYDDGSDSNSEERRKRKMTKEETVRVKRERKLRKLEQKHKKHSEAREKVRGRQVPLKFAIEMLARRFNSSLLMRDMLIYIPFLFLFMLFFYKGRDIEGSYWQARNVHDLVTGNEFSNHPNFPGSDFGAGPYFEKTFFDPLLPGDVSDWLETVVIPLIWNPDKPHAIGELNPRLTQSIPVGALRMRTLKVKPTSCQVNQFFYPNNITDVPRFCYSDWTFLWEDVVDKTEYGVNGQTYRFRNDCGLDSVAGVTAEYKSYPCGGFIQELPFVWDYTSALDWAHNIRRGGFINATSVRFVALEFFTYNIPLDSFSSHKFFWEITEGGAWVPQTQHRNFAIFSEGAGLFVEFLFLMYVLYFCVRFVLDWCEHHEADGRWSTFFFEPGGDAAMVTQTNGAWNMLEFINLLSFIIVFGIRWIWWIESNKLQFKLPYDHRGYPDSLNTIMNLFQFQIYFNSINTVISFLKILKYVRLNERLNILTRTLSSAQQDVMAVLVVFVLVLFSFAVSGNTLFGNGIHDFKNISLSLSTLMRTILGDFDYWELWFENQLFAFVFFFGYIVLSLFIIMNFIIGVVGTHFSKVQSEQPKGNWADNIARLWKRVVRFCPCKSGCVAAWRDLCTSACEYVQRPAGLTILQYLKSYYIHQRERQGAEKAKTIMLKFSYFLQLMPMAEFLTVREENLQDNWEYIVDEWDKMTQDEGEKLREVKQQMQVEVISEVMRDMFAAQRNKLLAETSSKLLARQRADGEEENMAADQDYETINGERMTAVTERIEEAADMVSTFAGLSANMQEKARRIALMVRREKGFYDRSQE